MNKILFLFSFILFSVGTFAQKPSKEQLEADKKRMAEAQKKLNETLSKIDPAAKKGYDSLLNAMGAGQKMEEAIKDVNSGKVNKGITGLQKSDSTGIPKKQIAILNGIPKILNDAQYASYLYNVKKEVASKIPPALKNNIDIIINKNKDNALLLNNTPPMFYMEQKPEAAIYAGICVAIINKKETLSQANLTSIFQLSGYPQYALPMLEYLNTKEKSDLLLSNEGQCYLSLGETEKAKTFFMRALAVNSESVSSNCGMGFIEANGPTPAKAAPYIEKVMKSSYSELLDKLVTQKNIKLNYKSLRSVVPVTFPPEKYKVRPAALTFEEVEDAIEKRLQIHSLEEDWNRKLNNAQDAFDAYTKNMKPNEKLSLFAGYTSSEPMAKKARFMLTQAELNWNDFAMRTAPTYNSVLFSIQKMQQDLKKANAQIRKDYPDSYDACRVMKDTLNAYLKKSANMMDDYVSRTIYDFYDYTNQQLYWNQFILDQKMYDLKFYQLAYNLVKTVDDYGNIQALDEAHNVVYECEKTVPAKLPKLNADEDPEFNCPVSFKLPAVIGSFKANCKGWSIEGGEGLVLGLSKDYKSGEFTVAFGVGGELDIPLVVGGSAAMQMTFTVGSDFIPSDMGLQGNISGEAGAGPFSVDQTVTAKMSIASGLNVELSGMTSKEFSLIPPPAKE
ncbi:MAG TPA: hypothetical protein VG676_01530 [Chitinophagaceae bacterium]|nr:hypothetical protein [Chitinophagaceae bacterium]